VSSVGPRSPWQDPAVLEHLARVRRPWDRLTRQIIRGTLARFLPHLRGQVVEVGSGDGQLRDWLPAEVALRTVHTEPSRPFLDRLRSRHPAAVSIEASATDLPFPTASVHAVLGLCVLDTMGPLDRVRDEVRRVLRAGGVLLHFLDLATSPDCLFPELIAGGEVPLTNFASDPSLLQGLSERQRSLLPAADEFDEVLAIRWEPFTRFVALLAAARHPVVPELGPYSQLHRANALDPDRLTREYISTSADPARLAALNRALLQLTLTARALGREWLLRPVSLRSHIRARLRACFSPAAGFETAFAGPVYAAEPSEPTRPAEPPFTLRHAGRTIRRDEPPPIPGVPVEDGEGAEQRPESTLTAGWRATTVEVFVAVKPA